MRKFHLRENPQILFKLLKNERCELAVDGRGESTIQKVIAEGLSALEPGIRRDIHGGLLGKANVVEF